MIKKSFVFVFVLVVGFIVGFSSVIPAFAQTKDAPVKVVAKNDYSQPSSWLCWPGQKDACVVDQASTIISADGTLTRENWAANPNTPIDCFYVYPTVSLDPTPNSDMNPGPEEKSVVVQQLARFGSQCRIFAPMYRQKTLTALRADMAGKPMGADENLGYNDILDAWNYYLKNENKGRGVVLIGHSQGARMMTQLIQNEIDGKSIQSQIISALLIGGQVKVPRNKDVGATFKHMPLCRKADDTGCIIAYSSFRSTVPPPANSRYGLNQGDLVCACTNPAALDGGSGDLHAYLAASRGSLVTTDNPFSWVKPPKEITTPFVSVPGLLKAKCVLNDRLSYLEITVQGDPKGPRTDDIMGDVLVDGKVLADWGLHLIDMNLAMGNFIDLVNQQTKAYLKLRKK
jgi:hypothetical protein